jgi:hypothetical protein
VTRSGILVTRSSIRLISNMFWKKFKKFSNKSTFKIYKYYYILSGNVQELQPILRYDTRHLCSRTRFKTVSTMAYALLAFLIVVSFLASPVASLGFRASSFPEFRLGSIAVSDSTTPMISPSTAPMIRMHSKPEFTVGDSSDSSISRRGVLGAMLAVAITGTGAMLPMPSSVAYAATTKSNYNYELGNNDCETACVRKCELASAKISRKKKNNNNNNNNGDCINACVRSGERYCHQTTANLSKPSSPSSAEATTSRYIPTTKEPEIASSKPIPGFLYNSNRGGAWRD